ncbi:PD-(D/E)XK nuclease-like domain-containing protein [Heyndrickxia ginsengihumi]|uniref:PD-(D/E)XK nuclease-like domain-containing protein n=1 Tax=Heyndrickxia ginsengihumi TaxID=363870 RepID=UPI003D245333
MMQQQAKLKLNSQNYHSIEANKEYLSVSQFKSFMDCEARTMAELDGSYKRPDSNALLVGSYLHSFFENEDVFYQFIEENNEAIFNTRGNKYADFTKADEMIETLKNDPFAMFALEGEKEEIYTANVFGAEWKIKVDSIHHGRKTFSDIKTTQDLHKRYWSDKYNNWVSFVESWDYVLQMAVYRRVLQECLGNTYTPYIVAITKENPPNKAVLHFDETRFDFEYEYIEMKIDRVLDVKSGKAKPTRCEKCDYCRSTKKLNNTMEIGELIYV